MKSFLTVVFAVGAVSIMTNARPQDGDNTDPVLTFAPLDPLEETTGGELSNEQLEELIFPNETSEVPNEVLSAFCPQCLYDFKGNRVNEGCTSEKPPACDKGVLVITTAGDDFEMCCCNYSNCM